MWKRRVVTVAACVLLVQSVPVASAQLPTEVKNSLRATYDTLASEIRKNPAVKHAARQWGIAPKKKPSPVSRVKEDCADCVALTFDDGPVAHTAKVLDVLESKGARASFMVMAGNAKRHPSLVRRMADSRMTVGNHTVTHRELDKLPFDTVSSELERTNDVISALTGSAPRWMRPPYGAMNDTVTRAAGANGLSVAMWDVDTLDWKYRDPQRTCRVAVDEATAGSIVLMHDIHATTVDAVACIVEGLRNKGLEPVSLDQLIPDPTPGATYIRK